MKKMMTILSALAAGALMLLPAASQASVTHPGLVPGVALNGGPNSWCWDASAEGVNSTCIWTDGSFGDTLHNKPYFPGGNSQTYDWVSAECGVIGPHCAPFTSGSGDNTLYSGWNILTLVNIGDGNCVDYQYGFGTVHDGSCTGSSGEVIVGFPGAIISQPLIFVTASNDLYAATHQQEASVWLAGNVNNVTDGYLGVHFGYPGNTNDSNLRWSDLRS